MPKKQKKSSTKTRKKTNPSISNSMASSKGLKNDTGSILLKASKSLCDLHVSDNYFISKGHNDSGNSSPQDSPDSAITSNNSNNYGLKIPFVRRRKTRSRHASVNDQSFSRSVQFSIPNEDEIHEVGSNNSIGSKSRMRSNSEGHVNVADLLKRTDSNSSILLSEASDAWDTDCYDEVDLDDYNHELDDDEIEDYPAWRPDSKRWRARFEALSEIPVASLRLLGNTFLFCDKQIPLSIASSTSGHMSAVFLGLHKDSGEEVAIKRVKMPKELELREQVVDKSMNVLLKLKHKNIQSCIDFIQKKPHFWYVQKPSMCNLRMFAVGLVNSGLSMTIKLEPVQICKDIISGLLHLKSQFQICHGNLTPQNILITETGEAKVTDIACIFKKLRGASNTAGLKNEKEKNKTNIQKKKEKKKHIGDCFTPRAWSGPEIIRSELPYPDEKVHFKSDVFSLGLLIFYVFSYGEHVFAPEDIYHSPAMVKENILNNNSSFKVRSLANFEGDESICNLGQIDIDERINLPRQHHLDEYFSELLENMVNSNPELRKSLEVVAEEFKKLF